MKNNINIGLCLLKIWMSFEVVFCHFWNFAIVPSLFIKPFEVTSSYAVPCFTIVSFFLMAKHFFNKNTEKMKQRLKRLIIPQIIWTIIYWGIYTLLNVITIDFKSFMYQLFLGHSFNQTMWFQIDMIIITILFIILFAFFNRKKAKIILLILIPISLIAQYSEANYLYFSKMIYEVSYPLGRLLEMMPYACLGMLLADFNLSKKLEETRIITILICSFIVIFLAKYNIILPGTGFGYQGLYLLIVSSCVFIIFYLLKFKKNNLNKLIVFMSKYTMGIYFSHRLVGTLLNKYIYPNLNFHIGDFKNCIVIYICSFVLSFLISKIPGKSCRSIVM